MFFFNGENISKICYDFRKKCLKQELDCDKLSKIEKMAINHVDLIDRDIDNSIFAAENDFFEQFEVSQPLPTVTASDVKFVNLMPSTYSGSHKKETARLAILNYLSNSGQNIPAKILYDL